MSSSAKELISRIVRENVRKDSGALAKKMKNLREKHIFMGITSGDARKRQIDTLCAEVKKSCKDTIQNILAIQKEQDITFDNDTYNHINDTIVKFYTSAIKNSFNRSFKDEPSSYTDGSKRNLVFNIQHEVSESIKQDKLKNAIQKKSKPSKKKNTLAKISLTVTLIGILLAIYFAKESWFIQFFHSLR